MEATPTLLLCLAASARPSTALTSSRARSVACGSTHGSRTVTWQDRARSPAHAVLLVGLCRHVAYFRPSFPGRYAAVDLRSANYAPITAEFVALDTALGDPIPPDGCESRVAGSGRDLSPPPPGAPHGPPRRCMSVSAIAAGLANAVVWTWEATLDDDRSAPPLSNAAYAPRTHWRQAMQLLPRGRAVAAGDALAVHVGTSAGRALSFALADGVGATRTAGRPHRIVHVSRSRSVETPIPSEISADSGPMGSAKGSELGESEIASLHRPPSEPAPRSLRPCSRRVLERSRWRARRARLPPPLAAPVAPDAEWLAALGATEFTAPRFGLHCAGATDNVLLCEAVLDLACDPARFGLCAQEAHQAVRVLYAG